MLQDVVVVSTVWLTFDWKLLGVGAMTLLQIKLEQSPIMAPRKKISFRSVTPFAPKLMLRSQVHDLCINANYA